MLTNMVMYKCDKCDGVFDAPLRITEDFGFDTCLGHVPAYQYTRECPYCGSNYYYEADQCEECGEWVPLSRLHKSVDKDGNEHWTCDKCEEKYDTDDE